MSLSPTVLSPALPSEVLNYIVKYQTYPTTLLICCSREDFVASLIQDVQERIPEELAGEDQPDRAARLAKAHPLLGVPLYQVAVSRHIRMLFVPSVSHLRALLSVFDPQDSKIPPPPNLRPLGERRSPPLLLAYGFVDLHRDSSEWSAQGLGDTAAGFVEAARRVSFRPVIVEPRQGVGGDEDLEGSRAVLEDLMPILNGTARKDDGAWAGRTVPAAQVLGRWFRFQTGEWDSR